MTSASQRPAEGRGAEPVLVLGLGNRLMMDDGVGVLVVEALMAGEDGAAWASGEDGAAGRAGGGRASGGRPAVTYAVGETDFEYALDLALPAERLVVVDAVAAGGPAGSVCVVPFGEMAVGRPGLGLHEMHFLDQLLSLAPGKQGVLVGIVPYRIGFGLGLSEPLQSRFDLILAEVRRAIGLS